MRYTIKQNRTTSSKKNWFLKKIQAFTLIEVIITLTILGLIFGSVMSVFLLYSTLWSKVEVNRLMQSNIKTIIEHIREDINENGINESSYNFWVDQYADEKDILYVWNNEYYLVDNYDFSFEGEQTLSIVRDDRCNTLVNGRIINCTLIKITEDGTKIPLSNSWVSFKNMNFHVSEDFIPKVTMFFEMSMANNKWIRTWLIEWSSINIQTTISQRITNN